MSEEKKNALTECASALSEFERRGSVESIIAVRSYIEGIAAGMELAKTSAKLSEIPERDFKDAENQTESA